VFDPAAADNNGKPLKFNAAGKCPAYELDKNIADAVLEHRRAEQIQMAQYIAQGVATVPQRHGVDGGMNPVFAEKLGTQEGYDSRGRPIQVATAPGALPRGDNMPVPATIVSVPRAPQVQPEPEPAQIASVPMPQAAPQPKVGEATAQPVAIASVLGNLFAGQRTAEASPSEQQSGTERATVQAPAPRAASRTPAAAPTRTASAVPAATTVMPPAKPKAVSTAAPASLPRVAQAETGAEQAEPAPQLRTAYSAQPPAPNGLLTGAQPVMPVGSFGQRWLGAR